MGVGRMIKQTMKERKVTQNQLARLANISQSGLSSIVNEAVSPKEETLRAIAKALDVSTAYLLGEQEQAPPATEEELDNALVGLLGGLTPEELQRVQDFIAGMKAGRKG